MRANPLVKHYMKYIKEEYRDDFVRDDEGEPYIKFSVKEFENFCIYIMNKVLYHKKIGKNY